MVSRGQLIDQFKAFCGAAGPALERSLPKPPIEEFRSFVESARPLLLKSVHDRLDVIQEALRCLEPWLLEDRHDLLSRHFPFGFRLEPIQARNVSYSNNLRLPRV